MVQEKNSTSTGGDNPSETLPALTREADGSGASSTSNSTVEDTVRHLDAEFTEEQVALFQRRFEEGFDVFIDKEYIRWLKLNHPEFPINNNLTAETINDPSTTDVAVACEQPAASMDLTEDQASSNTLFDNVRGTTSSLSNFLVCPAWNSLESAVPKQPTTKAQL